MNNSRLYDAAEWHNSGLYDAIEWHNSGLYDAVEYLMNLIFVVQNWPTLIFGKSK